MQALPTCPGPKMEPFLTKNKRRPNIKFLDLIGKGIHGYVFKVEIAKATYCLKAFKFLQPWEYRPAGVRAEADLVPQERLDQEAEPFYCELRAYGRLKETNREHLAVRSYGYMNLTQNDEDEIARRWPRVDWDRDMRPEAAGAPVRAIVKEFVAEHPDGDGFQPRQVRGMISRLKAMHRIGIVMRDIKEDAYMGGFLVDFSLAWVVPHHYMTSSNGEAMKWASIDMADFDDMLSLWERYHPDRPKIMARCYPNEDYEMAQGFRQSTLDQYREPFCDPLEYKWDRARRVHKRAKKNR